MNSISPIRNPIICLKSEDGILFALYNLFTLASSSSTYSVSGYNNKLFCLRYDQEMSWIILYVGDWCHWSVRHMNMRWSWRITILWWVYTNQHIIFLLSYIAGSAEDWSMHYCYWQGEVLPPRGRPRRHTKRSSPLVSHFSRLMW